MPGALRGDAPGFGGDLSCERAVRAVVVVVVGEGVELVLQFGERGGCVVDGEVALDDLVEWLHLAAGLGVIRTWVAGGDAQRGEAVLERDVCFGIVIQDPFGPTPFVRRGCERVEDRCGAALRDGAARGGDAGAVIEDVDDLHRGAVRKCPGGVVVLPTLVRSAGCEAQRRVLGCFRWIRHDELAASQHSPDRGARRHMVVARREVERDRVRSGVPAGVVELFAELDDLVIEIDRGAVRDAVRGSRARLDRVPAPAA